MSELSYKLKRVFATSDADAIVLMNTNVEDSNFLYLTGLTSGIFEQSILIIKRRNMRLLTSELEYETARMQAPPELHVEKMRYDKNSLIRSLKGLNNKTIGINASFLPVDYKRFIKKYAKPKKIIDSSKDFAEARRIKNTDEIKKIKHSVDITKKALSDITDYFRTGMTEMQITAKFEYLQMKLGAHTSFSSIVAFGSNASLPHYMPGNKRLTENTFILMDVGAKNRNYCSDITRTFIYKPDKKSRRYKRMTEMYDVVEKAQGLALNEMYSGNSAVKPHNAAMEYINTVHNGKYKGKFIHALGHSIGVDVHDGDVMPSKTLQLKEGMVFSDEPGVYINGFGGVRIEDDILIAKGKSKFL